MLLSLLKLMHTTNYYYIICFSFLGTCKQALGMESGAIADFQITASSAHDMGNVGPQHARWVSSKCWDVERNMMEIRNKWAKSCLRKLRMGMMKNCLSQLAGYVYIVTVFYCWRRYCSNEVTVSLNTILHLSNTSLKEYFIFVIVHLSNTSFEY